MEILGSLVHQSREETPWHYRSIRGYVFLSKKLIRGSFGLRTMGCIFIIGLFHLILFTEALVALAVQLRTQGASVFSFPYSRGEKCEGDSILSTKIWISG